ncbi:MAG: GGDEF domain-containing protein [Patulibacter minatonensis]
MDLARLRPDLGGRVSRRDIALSPAVWIVVWGTFAMFAAASALIGFIGPEELNRTSVLALSALLAVIAIAMVRMPPPEPDTPRTHALLALTYVVPMLAIIAFAPQGSAVAITAAFAGPLTSVWVVDRRQIVLHLTAATIAIFTPWVIGAVDDGTLVTCLCIAPTMWALALTCVVVLESAEAQGSQLAHLGKRDPLTGAGNRRLLDEELQHELSLHAKSHRPFSILTFDLNGFKALNDTVGHAAGDELLKATADVLLRTARPNDTVVRQGGDEFCLLLPGTSADDARVLGELVRASLQAVRAYGSGISTGIGLASCPADGTTSDALLATADERLRADKASTPRPATSWQEEVPEAAPREGRHEPGSGRDAAAPTWTIEGVSRRHLEALRPTWRAAAASSAFYAILTAGILRWAPELAGPGLEIVVFVPIIGVVLLLLTDPPPIGSLRNHGYVTLPYLLPAVVALTTKPGAIGLGMSMFVGPLAASRFVERRHVIGHLVAATVVFSAVLVVKADELPTVLSLIIVMANLWVLGFSCLLVLEASERQGRRLAHLVRRDPLTGLGNRRRLRERLGAELAHHAAEGQPLTLIALDLNGFKQVNDTLGHAAGDEILIRVANALKVVAAPPAEAMRQGGDEFAVLLPNTTADEARAVIAAISRSLGTLDAGGLKVASGLGTATFPDDADTVDGLLDRADLRLREHKYGTDDLAAQIEADVRAAIVRNLPESPDHA